MKIYQNLTIIGTSHIAKESIKEVKEVISREIPEIVALELDRNRLFSLLSKEKGTIKLKDIRKIGVKGYFFAKIGHWVEHKVGSMVGTKPGDEMITAFETAKKFNIKIALIDQKIEITLKKLSKEITWKEKLTFVYELIKSPFQKNKISFNLNTVPDEKIIKELLEQVKEKYPNVYKVLVEERNSYMAKRLNRLMQDYRSVIAIVGAGHVSDIIEEIKCLQKKS
ncbi:TraB family protein [Candidatus Woesearchaeota archaeon]|nr:TraB family protein [Candidatus Woesearchaeota archaeon]